MASSRHRALAGLTYRARCRIAADLLLEFRQRIIGKPVFLVGNSLGGGMALNMAFQQPEVIRALGLVSPAGAQITEERFAELVQSFQLKDAAGARVLAHKLFAQRPPLSLLLFADELRKMMSSETVKNIVANISRADLVEAAQLAALPMPTLLIWGKDDPYVRCMSVDLASPFMKGEYRVVEADAGHWIAQEAPALVENEVLAHLRAHPIR